MLILTREGSGVGVGVGLGLGLGLGLGVGMAVGLGLGDEAANENTGQTPGCICAYIKIDNAAAMHAKAMTR